jgi:CDP-paratose 2-epimerase
MHKTVLITGGAGLVGTECCRVFAQEGYEIISVDNYTRGDLFGESGDTSVNYKQFHKEQKIDHRQIDIRDDEMFDIIPEVDALIHNAAQPSHPKSIEMPIEDFDINTRATLDLLEAVRKHNSEIPFIFSSTNKVYGEVPNFFAYEKEGKRFEPVDNSLRGGFDESLRIDQNKHTPFGVAKAAADLYTQEYAHLYGLNAASFRMGCITGGAARAVEMHNWEPYFIKLALTEELLTIFGYEGYQVRDVIHARDLARLYLRYIEDPNGGEVYNVGGGRKNSISLLESIDLIEEITGKRLEYELGEKREADHQWWITDTSKVESHYPDWERKFSVRETFENIAASLQKELSV